MDDIKRALESIYAIQNQQQATEESVGNIGEAPSGAQSAQANLDKDVELKGAFNAKTFGALLGMDSSEGSLLASFLAKHKNGMQPSRNELLAAADVFRALIDAEPQITTQALAMLRRVHADAAEGAYESVEDEITQVVDESIRLTKEGVEECWGDMAAPAAPAQAGETMTVSISMPNKQISVTTDSADEVMNLLKLAGISVADPVAEPAVEPEAPAVDAEPAMVGAPAMPADHDADHELVKSLDKDGDGDHDQADHDTEKDSDDEKKDDKAIMGAKEVKEEDIDENAFNQAAAAAARLGKDEFEFPEGSGKMHPVKMDKDSAHQMGESQRILQLAGVNESETLNEGLIDMLKAKVLPKVMNLFGADAEKIANTVKQAAGGNMTLSMDNGLKVAQALGLDTAAKDQLAKKEPKTEAWGIAGNWQGKLIQLGYTILVGGGLFAGWTGAGGPWLGRFVAVLGIVLLAFADTFFSTDKGMVGAMGKNGNQGTSMENGPGAMDAMESDRILQLAGLGEGKLANSPANTSMDEPTEFDSLPSEKGTGAGKPDYGTRQSNMGGENPMALHSLDMEESFQQAMGEYRKFVAENISKKK